MIRLAEVDTRTPGVPKPIARLTGPVVAARSWWWGGSSWAGKIPAPLHIEVNDAPSSEAPAGLTDFFRTTEVRLVSERLRKVLEGLNAEIEFWPAVLQYHGKIIEDNYSAVNSLLRLKAVDKEKSQVELDEELGDALSVERLVLAEGILLGKQWAVVDEVQRIAVSQAVQDGVLASGCSGMRFIEPLEVRY